MAKREPGILLGGADVPPRLLLKYANRHGIIAGATGTGKTISLQVLAEGFSRNGVPVFVADAKGDLSGISQRGRPHPKIQERVQSIGIERFAFSATPTVFWDLFGKQGHPIRTTISEMGPVLLARMMQLNDAQEGVLNIVFSVADDKGMLLLDLKDLRAMLAHVADNASDYSSKYGNVSKASVGAIQRALLVLRKQRGEVFFGEPAFEIEDLITTDPRGRGYVNVLAADKLLAYPKLYATFLLWLLSELFEELPEVGDADRPRLVFIFDEAHLLFDDAPKALMDKVAQVVRLVRSKGVGVYFVTQSPSDVPDDVLGQLGNRVQHALRAFTPRDQKAVRAAAQTFRGNPKLDVSRTIGELGVGEALVSVLDDRGRPTIVQRTLMAPPRSRMGPATVAERKDITDKSPYVGVYDEALDRESAFEQLAQRAERPRGAKRKSRASRKRTARRGTGRSVGRAMAKSAARSAGSSIGRNLGNSLMRGLLGSLLK